MILIINSSYSSFFSLSSLTNSIMVDCNPLFIISSYLIAIISLFFAFIGTDLFPDFCSEELSVFIDSSFFNSVAIVESYVTLPSAFITSYPTTATS